MKNFAEGWRLGVKKILIVGSDDRTIGILNMLLVIDDFKVVGMVETKNSTPAVRIAKQNDIHIASHLQYFQKKDIDVVIDTTNKTGDTQRELHSFNSSPTYIPYGVVHFITNLINSKEVLIKELKQQSYQQQLVLDLTHDAMIAVNRLEEITVFNPSAEKMTGLKREEVIGREVGSVMPSTKLPRVIETGKPEINQEQELENGSKIITTRLPMRDGRGRTVGAFAVFRDITDIVNLAEEVTNLKSIQTMLNAIIQSSEEAISVVDEHGRGLMINPAYTRLTGLSERDVIGKPATADISEGESMHMQVLQTRKPVRGARMKVGQAKRDVLVNVAPVIVDGVLKGSVGIIHDVSEITSLTRELDRARQIIRTLEAKYSFEDIIGTSEEMKLVKQQAQLAASTPITILLRGESGTGKELFAHAIHNASSRKYNKFIRVNCAAISESLLESEMFGYEEGAFSGAKRGGKRGFFEEANNGSIFLDEIGELSIHMQAKLLRVLQENEIVRVGGTKPLPIDVRVITATNVNLEKRIAEGSFREDLYYRLNRMPIYIPPLRQRREDIPSLCHHLIKKINQEYGRNVEKISATAIEHLASHDWPGNVRELENVLGRAVINLDFHETEIKSIHIPPLVGKQASGHHHPIIFNSKHVTLTDKVNEFEKHVIKQALTENNMNKTQTARVLGISVRNLYYKMEKYNLENNSMQ